jgi:hypothetical protein
MAFITDVHCQICRKIKHEVTNHDNKCNECRNAELDKAKRTFLAGLKGLTVEERLARIEELFYDLNLDRRLGVMEAYCLPIG